jgi:FKBP-type peptidyl-prolyl cis-trans isomerase FkpA
MDKNKYLGVVWVVLSVLVVGGGAFFVWHTLHHKPNSSSFSAADVSGATSQSSSSSNSLNVGESTAQSGLGQLGSTSGQSPLGSAANGSTSSGSKSSGSSLPDPSSFAQYDKYKDSQSALTGDIQVGTGAELAAGQKAAVYYRGFLTNGTVFDETKAGSDGKPQPFVFTQGAHQVIAGWEQGFIGMKVGGVRLIIVPPAAGYGANAQGSIPANSVLVFEVQLLQVQ